jgi:hypothetical protein
MAARYASTAAWVGSQTAARRKEGETAPVSPDSSMKVGIRKPTSSKKA